VEGEEEEEEAEGEAEGADDAEAGDEDADEEGSDEEEGDEAAAEPAPKVTALARARAGWRRRITTASRIACRMPCAAAAHRGAAAALPLRIRSRAGSR
jgi:hypothetical protein